MKDESGARAAAQMEKPVISVVVVTYNHERYVRQAIEGVLAQNVDVPYEIVIGDDFSTDGTRAILEEYAMKNGDKIRLILQDHNCGDGTNTRLTLRTCRGEYIALCEGDDYWCSVDKLQKQYDFLRSNPDFSACSTLADVLYEETGMLERHHPLRGGMTLSRKDFLLGIKPDTRTCTRMYRSQPFLERYFSYDLSSLYARDNFTRIVLTEGGKKFRVLNETMSVYRVHKKGAWSMQSKEFRRGKKASDLDIIIMNTGEADRKYVEFNKLVYRIAWEERLSERLRLYLQLASKPAILLYYLARRLMVAWNRTGIRENAE